MFKVIITEGGVVSRDFMWWSQFLCHYQNIPKIHPERKTSWIVLFLTFQEYFFQKGTKNPKLHNQRLHRVVDIRLILGTVLEIIPTGTENSPFMKPLHLTWESSLYILSTFM